MASIVPGLGGAWFGDGRGKEESRPALQARRGRRRSGFGDFARLEAKLDKGFGDFARLEAKVDQGFQDLGHKVEDLGHKFGDMKAALAVQGSKVEDLGHKFGDMKAALAVQGSRIESVQETMNVFSIVNVVGSLTIGILSISDVPLVWKKVEEAMASWKLKDVKVGVEQ